jgi:hypothetical protein
MNIQVKLKDKSLIMAVIIFVLLVVGFIYINSFVGTPSEYKINIHYQLSSGQEKLKTDIIEGLKNNIQIDILGNNIFNKHKRIKEIENFIDIREATFYMHIELLAKQHKLSHDTTFNTIFDACNYVRKENRIPEQIPNFKH